MRLDAKEVRAIATLARLAISADDIAVYARNLSRIIDFVDQLNQTDTDAVEPMAHPLNMTQRLREDEVSEGNQRELFQRNAPLTEAGLYLVPRVIE